MATGHPAAPRAHDQVPSEPPVYDGPRPDEGAAGLVRQAVDAMMRRDLDAVERCVDIATAEGCDRAAASRMRALAHLARGDHAQAMQLLASVQDNGDHRHRARAALTRALILLHAGDPAQAVRAGLGALSTSRRIKDPRGEAAAMHALSWCFRALGRAEDADRIEDASPD
jgi:tetratricopeptide (TPR) repeat protein